MLTLNEFKGHKKQHKGNSMRIGRIEGQRAGGEIENQIIVNFDQVVILACISVASGRPFGNPCRRTKMEKADSGLRVVLSSFTRY